MELFEPILHFFEQRWVHNIIWAGILAIGTAVAAKVVSKTLRHLLNRDDNPLPASSIFINIARAVIWMIGGSFILDNCFGINANALVAALGVGGIAISLGFQDTLSNLIGGMQVTFMGIIKP
ncbi:MAG: mechanosensitive ion channel, partial [Collinsella sp.]|nr:mechanosensitive ion channel [Collinsella sp.]